MEIIREYRAAAYENIEEIIRIVKYPNGTFYIHFGEYTDGNKCPCYFPLLREGFESLDEAEAFLYRSRPKAKRTNI